MNAYVQAGLVALASMAAALVAWRLGRLPRPWWLLGWLIPLMLVLLIVGNRRAGATVAFDPPFSWVGAGRGAIALLGPAAAMLLFTPMPRLKRPGERWLVGIFAAIFIGYASVYPFVSPALVRHRLEMLKTTIDRDGVCLQSTPFTCGPAAAVTALRRMGIQAEEGELAILAHTCPAAGTTPDELVTALRGRYGGSLVFYHEPYTSLELPKEGVLLAVINLTFFLDHYVAVLEVNGDEIVVGDPLEGRVRLTRSEFEKRWRFTGIVVRRRP